MSVIDPAATKGISGSSDTSRASEVMDSLTTFFTLGFDKDRRWLLPLIGDFLGERFLVEPEPEPERPSLSWMYLSRLNAPEAGSACIRNTPSFFSILAMFCQLSFINPPPSFFTKTSNVQQRVEMTSNLDLGKAVGLLRKLIAKSGSACQSASTVVTSRMDLSV